MDKGFTVCVAENRKSCEPGVRLLLASLASFRPDWPVQLCYPPADAEFKAWVGTLPQVTLNAFELNDWLGFDIKPAALRTLLHGGWDEVLWMDSDIIVTADPAPALARPSAGTVIVAEEANNDYHSSYDDIRTRKWGLAVGRPLPFALNSCIVGVTTEHHALLERWEELLGDAAYRAAQAGPHTERPIHMLGDQEVLTALLASTDFGHLPLHILRQGRDVLQYLGTTGYTTRERLRDLRRGLPPFVHSQGYKAWWPLEASDEGYERYLNLYKAVTPYRIAARRHADALQQTDWLRFPGFGPRLVGLLGFGNPSLTGLPLAMLVDAVRLVRRRRP